MSENLHRWQKFYTAPGSDGMDKFHLWLGVVDLPGVLATLVLLTSFVEHHEVVDHIGAVDRLVAADYLGVVDQFY